MVPRGGGAAQSAISGPGGTPLEKRIRQTVLGGCVGGRGRGRAIPEAGSPFGSVAQGQQMLHGSRGGPRMRKPARGTAAPPRPEGGPSAPRWDVAGQTRAG